MSEGETTLIMILGPTLSCYWTNIRSNKVCIGNYGRRNQLFCLLINNLNFRKGFLCWYDDWWICVYGQSIILDVWMSFRIFTWNVHYWKIWLANINNYFSHSNLNCLSINLIPVELMLRNVLVKRIDSVL